MDRERRRKINSAATAVRSALRVKSPEDVPRAIESMGGCIKNTPGFNPAAEASIVKMDDTHFEIRLDGSKPKTRQLFSLAHEIGHLFLHMGYGTSKWNESQAYAVYNRFGANEEEFEANEFAAAFLMPEIEFKAVAKRANDVASEIAVSFGVSADAALNRGRWLGIFPWS